MDFFSFYFPFSGKFTDGSGEHILLLYDIGECVCIPTMGLSEDKLKLDRRGEEHIAVCVFVSVFLSVWTDTGQ